MNRVVIIEHDTLSMRLKECFCIEQLLSRGIEVEYWDLSQLIHPWIDIPFEIKEEYIKKIKNIEQLKDALTGTNIEDTLFILEVGASYENRKIVSLLKKFDCYCIKFHLHGNLIVERSFSQRMKSMLLKSPVKFAKHIFEGLYRRYILKFDYNAVASSAAHHNPDVTINHPDYEHFMTREQAPILDYPYIVFNDIYFPFHPDYTFSEEYKQVTSREYYRVLNLLFSHVEKKLGMPVVIAAHPKAKYEGQEFEGRKIMSNKTCNLVKFAKFAITSESNSLSYLSMAKIPFIFVYPESYKGLRAFELIQNLAKYCNKPAHNISSCNLDNIEFSPLDQDINHNYIYSFLTSKESENRRNVDSIIKLLSLK